MNHDEFDKYMREIVENQPRKTGVDFGLDVAIFPTEPPSRKTMLGVSNLNVPTMADTIALRSNIEQIKKTLENVLINPSVGINTIVFDSMASMYPEIRPCNVVHPINQHVKDNVNHLVNTVGKKQAQVSLIDQLTVLKFNKPK